MIFNIIHVRYSQLAREHKYLAHQMYPTSPHRTHACPPAAIHVVYIAVCVHGASHITVHTKYVGEAMYVQCGYQHYHLLAEVQLQLSRHYFYSDCV